MGRVGGGDHEAWGNNDIGVDLRICGSRPNVYMSERRPGANVRKNAKGSYTMSEAGYSRGNELKFPFTERNKHVPDERCVQ